MHGSLGWLGVGVHHCVRLVWLAVLLLLLLLLGEERVELGVVVLQELSELAVGLVFVFCQLGFEGIRDIYSQGFDSLLSALRHRLDLVNTDW